MRHKFQAVCIKNKYVYKGSKQVLAPSFIKGEIYSFSSSDYSTNYLGLGSITAVNERGVQVTMDEDQFRIHFIKL